MLNLFKNVPEAVRSRCPYKAETLKTRKIKIKVKIKGKRKRKIATETKAKQSSTKKSRVVDATKRARRHNIFLLRIIRVEKSRKQF